MLIDLKEEVQVDDQKAKENGGGKEYILGQHRGMR